MVLLNAGMAFGYCVYVLTSWVYCALMSPHVFPRCEEVWPPDPAAVHSGKGPPPPDPRVMACEVSFVFERQWIKMLVILGHH